MKPFLLSISFIFIIGYSFAQVVAVPPGRVVTNPNETRDVITINGVITTADNTKDAVNITKNAYPNNSSAQNNNTSPLVISGNKSLDNVGNIFNKSLPIINLDVKTLKSSINLSQVSTIRLIDVRIDQQKTGFLPILLPLKKQGYDLIGLTINQSPLVWLKKWLEEIPLSTDTSSARKLIFVLRDCWFSQDAFVHRHSANNSLVTTLNYNIELFTQLENDYYPLKKLNGEFSSTFEDGKSFQILMDSLQQLIEKKGIEIIDGKTEINKLKIDATTFNAYLNEIRAKKTFAMNPVKGVYESFEKFIDQAPFADSAIVIKSYNLGENIPTYATQIQPVINGMEKNSYGIWGYFDGKDLFYNTGNGLFIKLIKDNENGYYFKHLNVFLRDNIKPILLSNVKFGKSDYSIIKEYSRISPLTYKLNLSDGKLY
ncbi:MAG: hypothetical protein WCP74_07960 [Sphingobacteriia bacterium]|jgi:hypothetical protein